VESVEVRLSLSRAIVKFKENMKSGEIAFFELEPRDILYSQVAVKQLKWYAIHTQTIKHDSM